jgi:hypothetical protein
MVRVGNFIVLYGWERDFHFSAECNIIALESWGCPDKSRRGISRWN